MNNIRARAAASAGGKLALAVVLYWTAGMATGNRPPPMTSSAAENLWEQCIDLRKSSRDREALIPIEKLLNSFPDKPLYLSFEADMHAGLKDYAGESATLELFMKAVPSSTGACPELGRDYARLGQPKKALDAHRRCLARDPSQPDLMFYVALELEHQGKSAEAKGIYQKILAVAPGYPDASAGLARILIREGDYTKAQGVIDTVLKKYPHFSDALLAQGILAERQGNRALAEKALLEGIRVSPDYADMYEVLGRVYESEGNRDAAFKVYAKLKDLEPDNANAKAIWERLKQGGGK